MPDRDLVISADCHAAARWADYEPYLERRHLDAFRAWYGAGGAGPALRPGEDRLFDAAFLDALDREPAIGGGGKSGTWDPEQRTRELDADGVAGEVIFPAAENLHAPFHGLHPVRRVYEPQPRELRAAGARAYNRWLADLCARDPARRAGVALVDLADVDTAVEEIRRARRAGLRGGILLPAEWEELPSYNHKRYEPVWAVCAELGMPVNTHPLGNERDAYGDLPGATAIFLSEVKWFAHRPLAFLLWAGVFERHPDLVFVLTEQQIDWVPEALRYYDYLYERPIFGQIRQGLSLRPSEYFARQCWLGASFAYPHEIGMRAAIGVDRIMWGSDYPHAEGTWPRTRQWLRDAFSGVPRDERRAMLGGTAARVYGFDPGALASLAARIGPEEAVFA